MAVESEYPMFNNDRIADYETSGGKYDDFNIRYYDEVKERLFSLHFCCDPITKRSHLFQKFVDYFVFIAQRDFLLIRTFLSIFYRKTRLCLVKQRLWMMIIMLSMMKILLQ